MSDDTKKIERIMKITEEHWNNVRGKKSFILENMIRMVDDEEQKTSSPIELQLNKHRPKLGDKLKESCDAVRQIHNNTPEDLK
jgi:hypothetical protein